MKKNRLELQWTNKDKSLYFDLASGKYKWEDKKDPLVPEGEDVKNNISQSNQTEHE